MTPEELKSLRSQAGMSQAELSRLSGIPVGVLERFETNRRKGGISDYEDIVREVISEVLADPDVTGRRSVKPGRKKRAVEPQRAPIGPRIGTPLDVVSDPRRFLSVVASNATPDNIIELEVPQKFLAKIHPDERQAFLSNLRARLKEIVKKVTAAEAINRCYEPNSRLEAA